MPEMRDGPSSPYFTPLPFKGNLSLAALAAGQVAAPDEMTEQMRHALGDAPGGSCVAWGIPFEIGDVVAVADDEPVSIEVGPVEARWLVVMHTSDVRPMTPGPDGLYSSPQSGPGRLAEHAADYVLCYADGSEARVAIRRRHQIGPFLRGWGENCFQSVAQHKPRPMRGAQEQLQPYWGVTQMRATASDDGPWVSWLWAWENPYPDRTVTGLRFEPVSGVVIVSAITVTDVAVLPLRWQPRQKARLVLPEGQTFQPELDGNGLLKQIQLDLGQVISAAPRLIYPHARWPETCNNQMPEVSATELIVEYSAHPDACFHVGADGAHVIPVSALAATTNGPLAAVAAAERIVTLRAVERGSGRAVPVKLHAHGEWGEYLAPVDRHRILNPEWFEDYSVDFMHLPDPGASYVGHPCTYIAGETRIRLPLGRVYLEISKGFEIRPVRTVIEVTPETDEITIEIDKVLPWREMGWVTADTHVHFLSPISARLEGAAEGVNVINLLASQWGELMTNVGDFDGQTTWGTKEAGGDGEYLVRVGTENRQHVMGHISLLGYRGAIIAPMTTGGPDESALGDPIEALLTEWARQCRAQDGLVVIPHFPRPRAEHAAAIVSGDVDAVEMTSWNDLYSGISPYSVSDWYRYLNCGYLVPAVGGTDKMAACTAVGTVRTYARLDASAGFNYDTWKQAIRRRETFVTYGPLLEFSVDGLPMGSEIRMPAEGGTIDVAWQVASVTVPLSRVELVVNGEIRESLAVPPQAGSGRWSVRVDRSCWLALLVRGHYAGRPEIIAAHGTPVMIHVAGSPLLAPADAVTILDQIEGAMAYLDTVGTRAEDRAYRRMRLVLEAAHRTLHNRMHRAGRYHEHTGVNAHAEHGAGR